MSQRSCLLAIGGVLALGLVEAVASPPSVMPQDGVLVLRHGDALHGRITLSGDRYIVTWGDGGELKVPVGDVEFHCRDLVEAYQLKRAALQARGGMSGGPMWEAQAPAVRRTGAEGGPGADSPATQREGAGPHLELAEWCLRQSLLPQAADELLAAIARDPQHPRIRLLERRLELAAHQPAAPLVAPARTTSAASNQELDRTLRELPPPTVEKFTTQLQPLLLNRCGANACHGPTADSQFRLLRPSWGKTMTQRFTERNLHATLQQVNRQSPEASPLLTAANGPHGPLGTAVFSEREQPQRSLLATWVAQLGQPETAATPRTISPAQSHLLQTRFQPTAPAAAPPGTDAAVGSPPAAATSEKESSRPVRLPETRLSPRDPFDAEVFNQRFLAPAANAEP